MKYIILILLLALYLLLTMTIQEGMLDTTNISIKMLQSPDDWESIKSDIQQFLQETSSTRYLLIYPSASPIADPIGYLDELGEDETATKMLLYIWAPLNEDIQTELVDILGIDSVPSSLTKGLFTYDADSEAVTEVDYNVSITASAASVSKSKNKKGKKGVVNKAKGAAKKVFGGKKKKK